MSWINLLWLKLLRLRCQLVAMLLTVVLSFLTGCSGSGAPTANVPPRLATEPTPTGSPTAVSNPASTPQVATTTTDQLGNGNTLTTHNLTAEEREVLVAAGI